MGEIPLYISKFLKEKKIEKIQENTWIINNLINIVSYHVICNLKDSSSAPISGLVPLLSLTNSSSNLSDVVIGDAEN